MTTTYLIIANATVADVKSKKSVALDVALAMRNDERIDVIVATTTGKIVGEFPAPRKIKMSPAYTRVVEGVEAPEGLRVAYVKSRKGLAVLHDAEAGEYLVANIATGATLATFATTRECGRFTTDYVVPTPA